METVTLASGRTYLLARPSSGPPPWPVVVMLHGTGGSAEFAADETRLVPFADAHEFVLAFGEALPLHPDEPPKFLSNPRRWNEGLTNPADPFHAHADDVAYLSDLITDVLAKADGDPNCVYLTGFSNGAGMAFRFAAERGDLLAAVAPVAGYCPRSVPTPVRPVPTMFVVGDSDLLIPVAGGSVRLPWGNRTVTRPPLRQSLDRWAEALGCSTEPEPVSDADGVRRERYPSPAGTEFTMVTVAGLGHHWPGGKGQFNHRIGGPVSDRYDANAEIWSFFRRHRVK